MPSVPSPVGTGLPRGEAWLEGTRSGECRPSRPASSMGEPREGGREGRMMSRPVLGGQAGREERRGWGVREIMSEGLRGAASSREGFSSQSAEGREGRGVSQGL